MQPTTPTILLLGPAGCGKTCFLDALCERDYDPKYFPTRSDVNHQVEIFGRLYLIRDLAGQCHVTQNDRTVYDFVIEFSSSDLDTLFLSDRRRFYTGRKTIRVQSKSDCRCVDPDQLSFSARTRDGLSDILLELFE